MPAHVRRVSNVLRRTVRTVCRITAPVALLGVGVVTPAQAHGVTTGQAARGPIYIGLIASLTGPFAARGGFGQRDGARLALRQINAHGGINGRPLKLILANDASTTPAGTTVLDLAALDKLVHTDHVTAIIVPAPPSARAIEQARIPVIIGTSLTSATRQGNPWVFRTRPSDTYTAKALAKFAVSTLHLSSIALMYTDNPIGSEQGARERADLKALGVTPATEQTYPVLANDLTAQVLALKKSGAKALITFCSQPDNYRLLAQQMRQAGVHLTWLGNPILALAATQPGARLLPGTSLLYGTYAVTDFVAGQSPEATALDRLVRATFHRRANFPEAWTYDGMHILAKVMRKVGTKPYAIRRGILAIRGYRGAEGTYNFDRHGDGLHQYTIVQNVQGRLRVVKVISF